MVLEVRSCQARHQLGSLSQAPRISAAGPTTAGHLPVAVPRTAPIIDIIEIAGLVQLRTGDGLEVLMDLDQSLKIA